MRTQGIGASAWTDGCYQGAQGGVPEVPHCWKFSPSLNLQNLILSLPHPQNFGICLYLKIVIEHGPL